MFSASPTDAPRHRFPLSLCAVVATVLLAALLLGGCGSSSPSQRPARLPLLSIVQDDLITRVDPGSVLPAMHALGIQVLRVNLFWGRIAPDGASLTAPSFNAANPAAYPPAAWAPYDRIVRVAAATGMRVLFTITGPGPVWAGGPGMPHTKNCPCGQWKPSPAAFGDFVRAAGTRYSGRYVPPGSGAPLPRVSFWSIWNEPNYGPYLAPQAAGHPQIEVSPRLYRPLLDAAWQALKSTGHTTRTDTILIGETAPRGQSGPNLPGDFSGMTPLRFIRSLYCVDGAYRPLTGRAAAIRGCPTTTTGSKAFASDHPGLFQASGWADHPYPITLPPTEVTPPPLGTDYADFSVLGNLASSLDRAAAAYSRHPRLPLYNTEFGYRTDPPYVGGLPPATVARYLNQAEYLSWSNPRIRSFTQYLFLDPPPSQSHFDTGLEFLNGTPKPDVFAAFRLPLWLPQTRTTPGSKLEVWGCARPFATARRPSARFGTVRIQYARSGGRFRTVDVVRLRRPGDCYFDTRVSFPGSGSVRLAWAGRGRAVYSRIQQIRVH